MEYDCPTARTDYVKHSHTTSCIVHLADSAKFEGVTSNKLCNDLTGLCFESPNDTIHVTVIANRQKQKNMKRLVLLFMILVSLNAYSQYELDTTRIKIVPATFEMLFEEVSENDIDYQEIKSKYTPKQIERILDTSYVFFVLNDSVFSSGFTLEYSVIVGACLFLEKSNLTKNEKNNAFLFLV